MAFDSRKSGSKNPRFFCERCNTEVPADAEDCPECGRTFSSVRCPICDFIGQAIAFKGGCPACGHTSMGSALRPAPPPSVFGVAEGKKAGQKRRPGEKRPEESLPVWGYILAGSIFTGILAALFFSFF